VLKWVGFKRTSNLEFYDVSQPFRSVFIVETDAAAVRREAEHPILTSQKLRKSGKTKLSASPGQKLRALTRAYADAILWKVELTISEV
jgi:hypothetical protein